MPPTEREQDLKAAGLRLIRLFQDALENYRAGRLPECILCLRAGAGEADLYDGATEAVATIQRSLQ